MDWAEQNDQVAVRRCARHDQAEQYALVLTAMGLQSWIAPEGRMTALFVSHQDVARATEQLAAYDSENPRTAPTKAWRSPGLPRVEVALAYWTVLLFFFAAARNQAFAFDWVGEGAVQSAQMFNGEWWRAVTALCLHTSGAHILGNLVFGTVFLMLLSQVTGAGVATLAMIAAGAAGNVLSALVHTPEYTSIGASTAIFAGIGLLAALQQARRREHAEAHFRNWVPAAGGLALLGFLGVSGENTDIVAHMTGFASGIAAGLLMVRWDRDWTADRVLQWRCAGLAVTLVTCSWVLAAVA